MAQGITGFTDYGPDGKPYMGLIVTTESTEYKFFLANRETSFDTIRIFTDELKKVARELRGMPDKIMPVEGTLNGLLKP